MNTAIQFDELTSENEDQENYEQMISPMLEGWLPVFRQALNADKQNLPILHTSLKNVALMAWLAAKGNIPVSRQIIDGFREIFLIIRKNVLENQPGCNMTAEIRTQLEKSNMRLAKAITILDLANDPDIAALFPNAEK